MPNYFENFCRKYTIDPNQCNQAELDKIEGVCFDVISRDIRYQHNDSVESVFNQYIQLIKDYSTKFLPYISPQLDKKIESDPNQWTIIQYAAYHGYDRDLALRKIPSELLNKQRELSPALHLAATQSHVHTVEVLLGLGADVHLPNSDGQLALFCVLGAQEGMTTELELRRTQVYHCLLNKAPATIKHEDDYLETVVHLIAAYGYNDLLLEAIDYDPQLVLNPNSRGDAPIHRAILHQQEQTVQLILSRVKEASTCVGDKLHNPIHCAVISGNANILKRCCEATSDPACIDAVDIDGCTPWMLATQDENPAVMAVLQSFNADQILYTNRVTQYGR